MTPSSRKPAQLSALLGLFGILWAAPGTRCRAWLEWEQTVNGHLQDGENIFLWRCCGLEISQQDVAQPVSRHSLPLCLCLFFSVLTQFLLISGVIPFSCRHTSMVNCNCWYAVYLCLSAPLLTLFFLHSSHGTPLDRFGTHQNQSAYGVSEGLDYSGAFRSLPSSVW